MSDLVAAVAFVFRRKGETHLAASEFAHVVSLDLRWFPPSEAKRLLAVALEHGLVEREGDVVRPRFDVASVDIPVGFRPTLATLEEPPAVAREDDLLDEAARRVGVPAETLRKEAEAERERASGLLTLEAATVVAVARRGHDAREFARRARKAT